MLSSNAAKRLAFQFTPLREGRLMDEGAVPRLADFNSRPSARGDGNIVFLEGTDRISIHAPPRGATSPPTQQSASRINFNSRPSARGDATLGEISGNRT